jgi:hypothetical protein
LAFLRDLVERSVEPQPEGLGVLEEPGLFRSLHARLDPLDQRLLLLATKAPMLTRANRGISRGRKCSQDATMPAPSTSVRAPVSNAVLK